LRILHFARSLHYTPLFVLMDDGKEILSVEGFRAKDFFWACLKRCYPTPT